MRNITTLLLLACVACGPAGATDLRVDAYLAKESYSRGDAVLLVVRIVNTGATAACSQSPIVRYSVDLEVRGPNDARLAYLGIAEDYGPSPPLSLPAGGAVELREPLARAYATSMPGAYRVRALYTSGSQFVDGAPVGDHGGLWTGQALSEELTFTVAPEPPENASLVSQLIDERGRIDLGRAQRAGLRLDDLTLGTCTGLAVVATDGHPVRRAANLEMLLERCDECHLGPLVALALRDAARVIEDEALEQEAQRELDGARFWNNYLHAREQWPDAGPLAPCGQAALR